MKKYFFLLTTLTALFCITGCVSYYATPLSANSINGTADSMGPAITDPEGGWHPYASAGYFDKQLLSDLYSSAETYRGGTLSAGIVYHNDLEESKLFHPFIQAGLSTSLLNYTPYFTEEQYIAFESQGIVFDWPLLDYSIECAVKPGFTLGSKNLLNSYYVILAAEYENGDYASTRKKVDGIENTFNLVDNEFSFGFGLGADIQAGSVREFDIGCNLEFCSMINKTQSVPYSFIENNITGRRSYGGEFHRYSSFKYGIYADYKKLRVSVMMTDNEAASFHVFYKF